jgi:hypothetical protein
MHILRWYSWPMSLYFSDDSRSRPACQDPQITRKSAQNKYGPFEYDFDYGGQPSLGHSCLFSTRSGYVVRVGLVVFIKETGQLCVAARHTISFYFSGAYFTAEPSFACPHQDLLSLIPQNQTARDLHMCLVLISSKPHQDLLFLVPVNLVSKACPRCQTLIAKYPLSEDVNQAVIWVVRNLGRYEWPADCPWLDQCRLTGAWFSHNEKYWWAYQRICEERRTITEIPL